MNFALILHCFINLIHNALLITVNQSLIVGKFNNSCNMKKGWHKIRLLISFVFISNQNPIK